MLGSLFAPRNALSQASVWGSWGDEGTGNTASGERVTADSAMQLLTVYGCVRLISDSISTLPVDVYRTDPVSGRSVSAPVPRWLEQPTIDLDFTAWCGQVLASLLLDGNAYLLVMRGQSGTILELIPLDPAKVQVIRREGRKVYIVKGQEVAASEIIHIPALMMPGTDKGLSPVEYARQSIGLGLASVRYGSDFFANEGNMPGVIELPHAAQPGTMEDLAKQWRKKRRSGGKGLPGILQAGATWKPTGVTNEQAQFLSTRQYTASEIAGQMFLVDPAELGIPVQGTSLTYQNQEDRNSRLVRVTLLPWIVRLETAISALLMRPRYVKLNVDGLLRADIKTRFETYGIGITNGFLDRQEARDREDLGPMPPGITRPDGGTNEPQ